MTKVSADLLLIQRVQLIFVKTHYIVNQMSGRRLLRLFLKTTQHSTTACIRKDISQIKSFILWEKLNILELEADQLSEYCREFGLYYERSDKGMPKFDYENYLWDGNIPDKAVWYEEKSLPDSTAKKD